MATTGVVNGTDLRIYVGGTAIGRATTCSLSVSREQREILDKDSPGGGWLQYAPGRKSGTMSTDGFVAYDTANETVGDLFTFLDNGSALVLRFTTDEAGDNYWEASGFVSSWALNAPVEENSTYSIEFQLTGAVTKGTES